VAPLDCEHDAVQQHDEAKDGNSESTTDMLSVIMNVICFLICNQHSQSVAISVTKDYMECLVQSVASPELVQGKSCNSGLRWWK
jgi:hypothetical protein